MSDLSDSDRKTYADLAELFGAQAEEATACGRYRLAEANELECATRVCTMQLQEPPRPPIGDSAATDSYLAWSIDFHTAVSNQAAAKVTTTIALREWNRATSKLTALKKRLLADRAHQIITDLEDLLQTEMRPRNSPRRGGFNLSDEMPPKVDDLDDTLNCVDGRDPSPSRGHFGNNASRRTRRPRGGSFRRVNDDTNGSEDHPGPVSDEQDPSATYAWEEYTAQGQPVVSDVTDAPTQDASTEAPASDTPNDANYVIRETPARFRTVNGDLKMTEYHPSHPNYVGPVDFPGANKTGNSDSPNNPKPTA